MFQIAHFTTARCAFGLTALIAVGALAVSGCSSDPNRSNTSASTTLADASPVTAAPQSGPASLRLVAPDRSTFDTQIGPVGLPCEGSGKVPVILVAGTDDPISRWDRLVEDTGQEVLMCRFDPSSATRGRTTPTARADALSSALTQSGLPAPYVLVGHSLGGLTVRRFGVAHPNQLGAALLLDPTTPIALRSLHELLEADGWDAAATQSDADETVTWGEIPLLVLAHDPDTGALGGGAGVEAAWTDGQRQYAAMSSSGRFEQVDGAGHYIDHDAMNRVIHAIDALCLEATQ